MYSLFPQQRADAELVGHLLLEAMVLVSQSQQVQHERGANRKDSSDYTLIEALAISTILELSHVPPHHDFSPRFSPLIRLHSEDCRLQCSLPPPPPQGQALGITANISRLLYSKNPYNNASWRGLLRYARPTSRCEILALEIAMRCSIPYQGRSILGQIKLVG